MDVVITTNSDGWFWRDREQFVEVVPVQDTKEHGYGDECECNPRVEYENADGLWVSREAYDSVVVKGLDTRSVIVHNSFDKRELKEKTLFGYN